MSGGVSTGRALAIWGGCFACAALLLFFYAGVGLYPIFAAGALTLALTLYRRRR